MSMSDCPKCWNTPCDCGHDYKDWPVARLEEMVSMFQGLIAEKTRQAKPKPKKLIRVDDGVEDIASMKKAWMKRMNRKMIGHDGHRDGDE